MLLAIAVRISRRIPSRDQSRPYVQKCFGDLERRWSSTLEAVIRQKEGVRGHEIWNGFTGCTWSMKRCASQESSEGPPIWIGKKVPNWADVGLLVSSSGLAENPHESDEGNYGHHDDDDQTRSVQSL